MFLHRPDAGSQSSYGNLQSPSSAHRHEDGSLTHPVWRSHESRVHGRPSRQSSAAPATQRPLTGSQNSLPVQTDPSSHWSSETQGQPDGSTRQPAVMSHQSAEHDRLSSHSRARPGTHWPVELIQLSVPVQAERSSHWMSSSQPHPDASKTQPATGSQLSIVHSLPSSHDGAGSSRQIPA